ncbi:MAG: PorV/PorQ family protein, partial [Chitinophagaceae bacterium]
MRKIALCLLSFFCLQFAVAQDTPTNEPRVITTGVPFLLIAADARSAGLGDQGVATSADAFSMQYNPAKFAFAQDSQGVSLNYTPYLTELVNDISLGQLSYYNRFNERMAFAATLRYFSLGEIELRQDYLDPAQIVKPNELAVDVAYALKL